jgi:hypothetical protein
VALAIRIQPGDVQWFFQRQEQASWFLGYQAASDAALAFGSSCFIALVDVQFDGTVASLPSSGSPLYLVKSTGISTFTPQNVAWAAAQNHSVINANKTTYLAKAIRRVF